MKGRVALLLVGAAVVTAGCSVTLGELRGTAPARVGRATGNYQALGGCVAEALQTSRNGLFPGPGDLHYEMVVRPDEQRMLLTGIVAGHGAHMPLIDLTFRQADSENVVIESRWARNAAKRIDHQVWPIAERCAGGRLAVTPPIVR